MFKNKYKNYQTERSNGQNIQERLVDRSFKLKQKEDYQIEASNIGRKLKVKNRKSTQTEGSNQTEGSTLSRQSISAKQYQQMVRRSYNSTRKFISNKCQKVVLMQREWNEMSKKNRTTFWWKVYVNGRNIVDLSKKSRPSYDKICDRTYLNCFRDMQVQK